MLPKTVSLLIFAILLHWAHSAEAKELDWWQNAVIYQIYPRSFMDSDNDGNGDLKGIVAKLDELVDTGVTAVWLSPIYKSPKKDNGYDISDYKEIDEMYGNMDDFKELLSKAKEKGLKVVLDFVPNHSSNEHEWFKKSEARDPEYENFYIWRDGAEGGGPPNHWTSYFHGPAWTYSDKRKQWYFHQFSTYQPDLNYNEPKLVKAMKDVLTHWLDIGVNGFRVDIVSALFEDFDCVNLSEMECRNDQPGTYDMVYQWRTLLDDYQKQHGGETKIMMTESYSYPPKLFSYYGNGTHNGAHFTFNFWFITDVKKESNARDIKYVIDRWFTFMSYKYTANWVLGNHDQHRVASRFGDERVDGLAMLTMLLPGVTVTYQGEEIGMTNGQVSWAEGDDPQGCNGNPADWDKLSRDFQRTPYQWDGSPNAGFNAGRKPWLPVAPNYETLNRAAQKTERVTSHYRVYQEALKLKKTETFKHGSFDTIALTTDVLGLIRRLKNHPSYIVLVNVGSRTETANLCYFGKLSEKLIVKVPSSQSDRHVGDYIEGNTVVLKPYEALILESN